MGKAASRNPNDRPPSGAGGEPAVDFVLEPSDAANIRFNVSAPHEVGRAVVVLQEPARHPLQWGWLRRVRDDIPQEAFRALASVIEPGVYSPDFLAPSPVAHLDPVAQVEALAAAPLDQVERDLETAWSEASPPRRRALEPWRADPSRARLVLSDAAMQVWLAAIAPLWPQLSRLLSADLALRSRQLVEGGAARVIDSLHDTVSWRDGVVHVRTRKFSRELDCRGEGLLLVPSVFSWPSCSMLTKPPHAPTIFYPAHGVTESWPTRSVEQARALQALLGSGRARVLLALEVPCSTAEVAQAVGVTPPTATHHLNALRDAGWIYTRRTGRGVLHSRTPIGDAVASGQP